jgi:sporulation protein YlmC with PRC-barrel domain
MNNSDSATDLIGRRADDVHGARVGKVADVYVELETGDVRWFAVRLGHFGVGDLVLVPTKDAIYPAGRVWIPYERDFIRSVPVLPEPGAALTRAEAEILMSSYGLSEPDLAAYSPSDVVARPLVEARARHG